MVPFASVPLLDNVPLRPTEAVEEGARGADEAVLLACGTVRVSTKV
jgi:hypothetical protein